VANSCRLAEHVATRYATSSRDVRAIGNPTDFNRIDRLASDATCGKTDNGHPVIISVGRLSRQKRPDVLLDAFALLRRKMPARLWICGQGPLRGALAKEIASRGLEPCIRLLDFCQNPYRLMRQAAVFVLTSDYEGLPNALIEAQGLGVPAVATRCNYGPDEIVADGETGLLTPVGEPAAIAKAIQWVLADPSRHQVMGRAAATRVRRLYDATDLVRQWEELLTECCPGALVSAQGKDG
jgi:glycosyltransferase involved in cell wall biosynthesis